MDKNKYSQKNKSSNSAKNLYDDGNIPEIDRPQNGKYDVEPLPESSRPRKDGPGGD